jgi:hypothetical protein
MLAGGGSGVRRRAADVAPRLPNRNSLTEETVAHVVGFSLESSSGPASMRLVTLTGLVRTATVA